MMLKIDNYTKPIGGTVTFINENVSISDFWILFCAINMSLLIFNLLPIPILDGGQLIMCIIRRMSNKFQKAKKYIDRITNIVYLICWIVLLLPFIIEIINLNKNPLVTTCYIIMGILMCILVNYISKNEILKNINKKV